jgi:hypothetical protein
MCKTDLKLRSVLQLTAVKVSTDLKLRGVLQWTAVKVSTDLKLRSVLQWTAVKMSTAASNRGITPNDTTVDITCPYSVIILSDKRLAYRVNAAHLTDSQDARRNKSGE